VNRRAEWAIILIALIWGSTFVIVKDALASVSTLLFLALRFTLATAILALAFLGRYGRLRWNRTALTWGILLGVLVMLGFVLQTAGLRTTTASKSAFLTGLYIVLVPLLASSVYRKAPQTREWLGIFTATGGMALMTWEGNSFTIQTGDLLTIGCAVAFSGQVFLLTEAARRADMEVLTLLQVGVAALLCALAVPFLEAPRVEWNRTLIVALVVTSLLATAVTFTLQTWAQRHTTATRAALLFALEPVFGWFTAWLWAGERLGARQAAGAALILAGILLVEVKPQSPAEHPS
jgi:drug/metabolite transporter (DMT)-like permease